MNDEVIANATSVVLIFTQRLSPNPTAAVAWILPLAAEERQRSRYRTVASNGQPVYLQLPRGTVLHDGDLLQNQAGQLARVVAKAEPVLTVTAPTTLSLLQAAYHLGNRHVPLEITATYLRLSPDPVLRDLLQHRGLAVIEECQPFQPETGAYPHSH